jgi:hypothetical protein
MSRLIDTFLSQPMRPAAALVASDFPSEAGVYAWYRNQRLFYVGETHRGLRSRLWGNHLRGNARGSTLRNKVAKAFAFEPIGVRSYGPAAEAAISGKLRECELRFLALELSEVTLAQSELIRHFDPPMNDHPGEQPRWRVDEVRRILEIDVEKAPPEVSKPPRERPRRASRSADDSKSWALVEAELTELARSKEWFPTVTGKPNRILSYEPGQRVLVETETGTNPIEVSWIKTHWQTLITQREVTRNDLLYPGRRSAFMLALFRRIPGIEEIGERPARLRIGGTRPRPSR